MKTNDIIKYNTVLDKNTFYFNNHLFQEKYDAHINAIKETLLVLKNEIEDKGLKKEIFDDLLLNNVNGLRAILALTGFANESLKRLITLVRIVNDSILENKLFISKWNTDDLDNIKEYSDSKISSLIISNSYFRKAIINIFFEGATIPLFVNTLPLFELKKLSISKLRFDTDSIIDTLVRYKEKGSLSGISENNPEYLLSTILTENGITYEKGDLTELLNNEQIQKRTMDFIIPSKDNPLVIIESSFLVTTSSGQGDKSKTEINVSKLIKKYYPKTKFIGFVDGIGWYVRKNDLKRMVVSYDDVFTFRKDELSRFVEFIKLLA